MRNAVIFHGTGDGPESYWYGWLGKKLEAAGYTVDIPHYPDINKEPIDSFLPQVLQSHVFDEDTVLVGHSAGSPLILSLLEHVDSQIAKAVMVAGFCEPLEDKVVEPILQGAYDWGKIKRNAKNFVFINSVNDPWGCDDKQGRKMFEELGGVQVVLNDGHFGSESKHQAYSDFPLLATLTVGDIN